MKNFIAVLDTAEERAWRRLTIRLWAESLTRPPPWVAVLKDVAPPRARCGRHDPASQTRGELPEGLNDDAMARLLIAAFQGLVSSGAWDAGVDAAACAEGAGGAHRITQSFGQPRAGEPHDPWRRRNVRSRRMSGADIGQIVNERDAAQTRADKCAKDGLKWQL